MSEEKPKVKFCKECSTEKNVEEFYFYNNYYRSECKKCCIKKNSSNQKNKQLWKSRFSTIEEKRAYMREYYAKNKDKYKLYRERFAEKHPDYMKRFAPKKEKERL